MTSPPPMPEGTLAGAHGLGGAVSAATADRLGELEAVAGGPRIALPGLVAAGSPATAAGRAGPVRVLLQGWVANAPEPAHGPGGAGAADAVAAALARSWPEAAGGFWGGWSLVAWHEQRQEALLARDPLGHDALHYAEGGGEIRFAGTVAALLRLLPASPAPDRHAVHAWLATGARLRGRSMFAGVRHVRAGHGLLLSAAGAREVRLARHRPPEALITDRREAVAELRRALDVAVERSLTSGGPSGILLSGGLDSGSVAALAAVAARRTGAALHTFSATFPGLTGTDERHLIDEVVAGLGAGHTRLVVDGRALLPAAAGYALAWRSPLGPPAFAMWDEFLRQEAPAAGAGVMLDGNGGDEMFGWAAPLLADRLARGDLLGARQLARRAPGAARYGSRRVTLERLWQHGASPLLRRRRVRRQHADPWIGPEGAAAQREVAAAVRGPAGGPGPRWWRSRLHAVVDSADLFGAFEYTRQARAGARLRPRHPLRDLGVLDVVQRIDPALTFVPSHNRALLREAVAGLLPDSVRLRYGKSVFDPLLSRCFEGWDAPLLRRLLEDPGALVGEYVDLAAARASLHEALAPGQGSTRIRRALWRLGSTELWLRAEADAGAVQELLAGVDVPPPAVRCEREEPPSAAHHN